MELLRHYTTRLFLGLIISLASFTIAFAGNGGGGQVKALAVLDGSQHQIQKDSSVTVVDSSFFDPSLSSLLANKSYTVQNAVTVMINEASTLYMHSKWTATVKLLITWTDSTGAVDSVKRSFMVGYDSAGTYNSRNTYSFQGAHKVTVKVISDSTNASDWDPTTVLLVENQLITHPAFVFNCQTTIGNITLNPSMDTTADELPVSWNAILGADQYDLEWTYVYDSALKDGRYYKSATDTTLDPAKIFRNSATRVTITGTTYNIPLIYDDYGTLFVRVRPAQLLSKGAVETAIWSSDASPSVMGAYQFMGHQRPLNWQSNISYAEEGKRKVVLQYFDGSLRSRQTVTKDNTTNTTIVGETYYDYQGRPAIQVMPAPTLNTIIKYTAGFNVSYNSPEYSQSNFDTLASASALCDAHADSMINANGASLYYSPKNPQATIGMNQFIPDAEDYPFTETEYTPDNTGRIYRQGGVGKTFQLSSGHETKYYYGTPDQHELDALFGTEVGDKSHYFKNMVRDANGQYSVSYVDMHGRTIATALAGQAPAGMAALPSSNTKTITETLADSGSVSIQGLSMVSQKSLVVPQAGTFNFTYNFLPDSIQETNCQNQNICYTCRYDLDITITDNCNNQTWNGQPYTVSRHNFSLADLQSNPCLDTAINFSFPVSLPEGSYVVTKKLTINQDAYKLYRDSVYIPNNTCTSLTQLIAQQKTVVASKITQCSATCDACKANVGSFSTFLASYNAALGLSATDQTYTTEANAAYQNALSACAAVCSTSTDVDDIKAAMLQDMSPPYGQYADTLNNPAGDIYSIFYMKSTDTGYVPVFKLPEIQYLDANGKPDSVYNAESGLMMTPNSLTQAEFVSNFRPSWANALLIYHPDYCRFQEMENISGSYTYDRSMESIDNFDQAKALGYLNPINLDLFDNTMHYGYPNGGENPVAPTNKYFYADLKDKMMSYANLQNPNATMTIWGMAVAMVKCQGLTGSAASSCYLQYQAQKSGSTYTAASFGFNDLDCDGDRDMAWRNFRQMYLQIEKDYIYKEFLGSPSGCTPANSRAYTSVPTIAKIMSANHTSSFNNAANLIGESQGPLQYLSNISGTTAANNAASQASDSLKYFWAANCKAFETQWYQQLTSSCTVYDTTDVKNTLLPALYSLCYAACDGDHPYGASTLGSGSVPFLGVNCTSFQQIVNLYNQSKGITDQVDCNAELITAPLPYNNQPIYSSKPVYGRPSDCECSSITNLNNQYKASHYGDASFSAYLKRTQQITMTDADLTTLLNMCSNTTNSLTCKNNSQPINLPPAMQCYAGQTCSSCQTIDSLYGQFKIAYPGILPTDTTDVDTAQATKNRLFQNYMNNRLGYNLQFWQYLQFMDTCAAHAADTVTSKGCTPTLIAQTFSSGGADTMTDIRATADGGYILAGYTRPSGATYENAYLMRYNSAGAIQWAKTYVGTSHSDFFKVRVTSDGGFVAVGTAYSATNTNYSGKVFVVKTDSSGNTQWQQLLKFNSTNGEYAVDIIQTKDGGYVVTGDYNLTKGHAGPAKMLMIKLDNSGNVIWTNTADNGNGTDGYGAAENAAGTALYFVGRQSGTGTNAGSEQGVLIKVDESTGNTISQSYLENNADELQIPSIAVVGNRLRMYQYISSDGRGTDARIGVLDLDTNLNVKYSRLLPLPPGNSSGSVATAAMTPTSDGGWLVGQTGPSTSNIFWVKFDSSGNILWRQQSTLTGSQKIGSVVQNADGSYTALGTNSGSAMVLQLSSDGKAGCFSQNYALTANTPITTVYTYTETMGFLAAPADSNALPESIISISTTQTTCPGSTNCYVEYDGPILCGKAAPILTPTMDSVTACSDSTFFAVGTATSLYSNYSDSLIGDFEQRYLAKCMNAYKHEAFTVTHNVSEYHYTLYYYDQAGNLLKTVPPAGVQQNTDGTWLDQVAAARAAGTSLVPAHTLVTNYRYNTINQPVAQRTPDAGGSRFWYDRLGRLAISQNARQNPNNQYSYTEYDTIGRVIQVGQLVSSVFMDQGVSRGQDSLAKWITAAMPTADQITTTTYDVPNELVVDEINQSNVRNRTSWTSLFNNFSDLSVGSPAAATSKYFSYDIIGNVDTLVNDFGNPKQEANVMNKYNRFKKIVYDYDFVSGKVNKVSYQHGYVDAFYHNYQYDAENRITNVSSSTDSINWDNDAFYSYYAHGPLARTVIGQQQVQGVNYAYALQGWVKAINPDPYTGSTFTMRPDSSGTIVANNAYNLLLDYFDGDYRPISGQAGPDNGVNAKLSATNDYHALYNGNISSMGVNIKKLSAPILYNYLHDQLNRLVHMDVYKNTSPGWNNLTATTDFQEGITYDPNGNILTYHRNRETVSSSNEMDQLKYSYITNSNQLDHIYDSVSYGSNANDVVSQDTLNYKYDSIGELVSDNSSKITNINWTVYGKIASITKAGDTTIRYTYDPSGNRISKSVVHSGDSVVTWYVHDAQGNILSVYTSGDPAINGGLIAQTELDIYGSRRLGVWKRSVDVSPLDSVVFSVLPKSGDSLTFTRGSKLFELANHLGNVLVTISDKRYGITSDNNTVAYYNPEVVGANDYYPFGMLEESRSYAEANTGNYRYGFNGKEADNEVKGVGNQIDYGMRVYDSRLGKFLSVDPLTEDYPYYSSYQYAGNMPIYAKDIDGLEPEKILNKAESMLFTPYEYGGKTPNPSLLGSLKTEDGTKFWVNDLRPALQTLSDNHPDHSKSATSASFKKLKDETYAEYSKLTTGSYSLGIDCSGFVFRSYLADKQLVIDPKKLDLGSKGQLELFKSAEKDGQAYVYKNPNLISAGDFVYKPGHVMVATGHVKVNSKGQVTEFQTYEANDTQHGSIMKWRAVKDTYVYAHPARTHDQNTTAVVVTYHKKSHQLNVTMDNQSRAAANRNQTVDK